LNLSQQEYKMVTKQWIIFILIALRKGNRISYKNISIISQIPTATLSVKLRELIKYKYVEKFVYGSIRKPHNTDYKITNLGLSVLNGIIL